MKDFVREDVLLKAAKLAAISTLAVAPYMVDAYFFNPEHREIILGKASETALPFLFARDLLLAFVSLMISAACGFAWSDGKRVAGFGTAAELRKDLKAILVLGVLLGAATGVFLDIGLLGRFRIFYPENPLIAISIPLRAAFYEEVICRFGILMIVFRLTESVPAAILLSSLFNAALGLRSAAFVAFPLGPDWLTIRIVAAKVVVAGFFGYFYTKKGLMATIMLRFIMELKHVVLSIVPSG